MHGIDAVGCRVVHGGERFAEPTLVTPDVLATIRELGRLAPLHNPASAMVLDRVQSALPNVPIVAVFDTAYHRTIPYVAALYALPWSIAQEKGLRRYGFHGTSHQYVAGRLRACAGGTKHITCHLGNGASICAIKEGKSLDTSMGLTPLEGLMMGTRSGDVDPGLVLHLLRHERRSVDEVEHLLNQQSGLFGIAGHADLRDVEAAAKAGDTRAVLAIEMFAYRVRKYIGAYAAVLEGVDAIAFTAGIGEHSAAMRARICTPLCWLGVHLDVHANAQSGNGERRISTADSPVTVWVIPTDEEAFLARETVAIVTGKDRVCTR
jgi:acetate kinase